MLRYRRKNVKRKSGGALGAIERAIKRRRDETKCKSVNRVERGRDEKWSRRAKKGWMDRWQINFHWRFRFNSPRRVFFLPRVRRSEHLKWMCPRRFLFRYWKSYHTYSWRGIYKTMVTFIWCANTCTSVRVSKSTFQSIRMSLLCFFMTRMVWGVLFVQWRRVNYQ